LNGYRSVIIGDYAGDSSQAAWTTIVGNLAGRNNKSDGNTFFGSSAGEHNTTGYNCFIGDNAGINNTTGNYNTFIGNKTGYLNNGFQNTAVGSFSLYRNTSGNYNTAIGEEALYFNNSGIYNTANGFKALQNNTNGSRNMASGALSLNSNTIGINNTSIGVDAMYYNTSGNYNTALGDRALVENISGSNNIAIGFNAGTHPSTPFLNNTISIGNDTYLNGANNQTFIGNLSTVWNGGNKVWSTYSDERMKNTITEDVKGLDFILRLKPVTYYRSIKAALALTGNKETPDYPNKYDVEKIKETGFLAQQVVQSAKDAGYDFSGVTIPKKSTELYTLSYELFVVPLVKAVQEQQTVIDALKKQMNAMQIEIELLKKKNTPAL
jgi:trimeric autotransporter adhesin